MREGAQAVLALDESQGGAVVGYGVCMGYGYGGLLWLMWYDPTMGPRSITLRYHHSQISSPADFFGWPYGCKGPQRA